MTRTGELAPRRSANAMLACMPLSLLVCRQESLLGVVGSRSVEDDAQVRWKETSSAAGQGDRRIHEPVQEETVPFYAMRKASYEQSTGSLHCPPRMWLRPHLRFTNGPPSPRDRMTLGKERLRCEDHGYTARLQCSSLILPSYSQVSWYLDVGLGAEASRGSLICRSWLKPTICQTAFPAVPPHPKA